MLVGCQPLFKSGVREGHHAVLKPVDEMLKGGAILDICSVTIPSRNQTQMIRHKAELAANYPAPVGLAFLAALLVAASFLSLMEQLDAIANDDA
jgi:hypothetical protein